jgi:hypothetical protein
MNETVMTIKITAGQKKRLRRIALDYGYTIGRGKEKNWGSVRKLMAAVADGKLQVVKYGTNGN